MNTSENPIAAYNDFLRANLANEERAQSILNVVAAVQNTHAVYDHLFEVAQCCALSDWPSLREVPASVKSEYQRHDLQEAIALLKMTAAVIACQGLEGHEEWVQTIEKIRSKCGVLFDGVQSD